ncbi:hypothetical protein Ocin01_03024 [Orchesella cincta]|uniref:Uncharacterized protein n=1 Tax=Orchesella cincta TaxID=48709 RepID=A0A1D2NEH0_ORCCI|nr:hypothetical protein Ocin01_03024 [Orchesella cincta]
MNMKVYAILILTFLLSGAYASCTCDNLVLTSIFQTGTCGRAARCNWELMHLKSKLKGDNSMDDAYEAKIREMLCRIPTYGARKYASENQVTFQVCNAATPTEFYHFSMPTTYFADEDKKEYLERMQKCVAEEKDCDLALWAEIETLCRGITSAEVTKLNDMSHLKIRDFKVYEFSAGSCKINTLRRKSVRRGPDETTEPTYEDSYEATNLKYSKLRSPYFELYLLYALDPMGQFGTTPVEERWDEKKAFKELAKYLPELMIHHMHTAIQCIYNRVNSNHLKWDPTKYCELTSTFVCVDKAQSKNTDCIALGYDPHDITKVPV